MINGKAIITDTSMKADDDNYKKTGLIGSAHDAGDGDSGDSGKGGKGGSSGQIAFVDFIGTGGESRDDLLSPDAIKRLLTTHQDANETRVKKQKEQRELLAEVKANKTPLSVYREARQGGASQYRAHSILANAAQFSGITDKKVSGLPTEFASDTNNAEQKKEQLLYQKQFQHEFVPKSAPRLER